MSYCASRFETIRRRSVEVKVGSVGVGGSNPVRLQSMTTSDTQDIAATVKQSIALAEVGCEIVRITAPNVTAARCLKEIRAQFNAAGFSHVPLVADIHFLPSAAMEAVEHVEKVRVNPGNYADKKKFAVREYSDNDYDRELERLHETFSPLVLRAKELGRSLRIGTNHGSLSDRIMNRYGDTPLGMVESALEFLRIAESHQFNQMILSMKASNPKVMIQAYRLLVERMQQENMHYPLHLGVTEAGDGEDGRIKSAIGIGSLLLDGLGDTIRVSLTEDSVYEIPVARTIAVKVMSRWIKSPPDLTNDESRMPNVPAEAPAGHPSFAIRHSADPRSDTIDPFHFSRRVTPTVHLGRVKAGADNPPVVITPIRAETLMVVPTLVGNPKLKDTPFEGLLVEIASPKTLTQLPRLEAGFYVLELAPAITLAELNSAAAHLATGTVLLTTFDANDPSGLRSLVDFAKAHGFVVAVSIAPTDIAAIAEILRSAGAANLIVTLSIRVRNNDHAIGQYRQLTDALRQHELCPVIWIRNTVASAVQADNSFLSKLLEASFLTGALLCDGIGDLVSIETESDATRATKLTYNVLQGTGARSSKTEFVACPSCGRTLFDLQSTTQRIREQTGHLKGVKLAIMGCIVNGPGEMADADFGYVGGAPGKINLYVGKQCVQYNIPQAEADARLIALIKEYGKWVDPEPVAI